MKTIGIFLGMLFLLHPSLTAQEKLEGIDEITAYKEGLAAVRKGNQWGFINKKGELAIDFRDDLVWNKDMKPGEQEILETPYPSFENGMCPVQKMEDEIPLYGFINTNGELIVDYKFLNVSAFKDGYATGVYFDKVFRGNNEFNLKIFEFKFHDVLIDSKGKIIEFFDRRYNIQMTKKRYKIPALRAKFLSNDMVAIFIEGKGWEIRKIVL
ncbi:WG repeat-containing protein [Flagellimonas sp. S3867]|uniref:WG repeat-containing protein n=1 Tax=Flagellimonas sp. S3867 TaxID=2768063 RepID=UPI001682D630|nr:WG repeat-containing protein [Flagellimonas sp. S3867]